MIHTIGSALKEIMHNKVKYAEINKANELFLKN